MGGTFYKCLINREAIAESRTKTNLNLKIGSNGSVFERNHWNLFSGFISLAELLSQG
jgi:hypothetical protein